MIRLQRIQTARSTRSFAMLCALVVSLAACSRGYPEQDESLKSPAEMSPGELLAEMNRLGRQAHLGDPWRYALKNDCVLEVKGQGEDGEDEQASVAMRGATITAKATENQKFVVRIQPKAARPEASVVVLARGKWTDSVGMRSLLQYVQRACNPEPIEDTPV